MENWNKSAEFDKIGPTMEEFLESKQDYKKLSKKFTETLTSIPDDVLIKYTQQETLEKITEQIQNECHIFVESVTNVTYQDATNTFLFMKLAELTLKLKKYEK